MIKNEIKLSDQFKKQTTKAIASIVLFALVYLIITALAVGLTALCVYAGLMLVISFPRFITIALGIGLASLGVLILIFLLKFLFSSNKMDRSHLHQIKEQDEPKLFGMINDIVQEVGTGFPKKVYLSAEVNASVFYDSSFWSMFFPVRKNLVIGMGLVNTISGDELRAILSHEFGHFSQRTMKVGSYVYNVNKVVYNMLFDNGSYEAMIHGWASISGFFSIFVMIAVNIIQGIQGILKLNYELINTSYMGLSREMEFHADEIAANVTGYLPLKKSLLRMDLAEHSYQSVLNFYEGKLNDNLRSENIFKEQSFVMKFIAKDTALPFDNNLPSVSLEELNKYNKSKLVVKDQWASHPSVEERIEKLEKTNLMVPPQNSGSANEFFTNFEQTQKEVTEKLFAQVEYKGEIKTNSLHSFDTEFHANYIKNSFSKIYKGYYDNKNPLPFDLENETPENGARDSLATLFSEEKLNLIFYSLSLQGDLEGLKQIGSEESRIKSFDYDGKKYKKMGSYALVKQLQTTLDTTNETIADHDLKIYQFFLGLEKAKKSDPQLKELYQNFFAFDKVFDQQYLVFSRLMESTQFINYNTPFDQIRSAFYKVNAIEKELKALITPMLEDPKFHSEITPEMKETLEKYCAKKWQYFDGEKYLDENLDLLFTAANQFHFLLSRGYFVLKKKTLLYQAQLVDQ